MSAVGGFMGQQSQTTATNRARLLAFDNQKIDYYTKGFDAYSRYNMKKAQFSAQIQNNKEAYYDTVRAGDRRAEQLGRAESYAGEQRRIASAQALGKLAASEQSGVSAGRLRGASMAEFGRAQNLASQNLLTKRQDIMENRDSNYRKMLKANTDAYSNVYIPPKPGPAPVVPVMQPGPNPLSLIGGIGSSIIGGIQMHNDMNPPGQV